MNKLPNIKVTPEVEASADLLVTKVLSEEIDVSNGWDRVTPFVRAYLECALWSSHDESNESGGDPMDYNYSVEDFAGEAVERATRDCDQFQRAARDPLSAAYERDYTPDRAGHDFWLTRNGHGAGFWDRDELKEGEIGEMLTSISKQFGECDAYIGDDGSVHFEGGRSDVVPTEPVDPEPTSGPYSESAAKEIHHLLSHDED